MRSVPLVTVPTTLAALAFALAACSFEATVTGEEVADAAADALEEQVGDQPEIDCGDDSVTVAEGKEVDSVLTDPATGTEYDATVTITEADGAEWKADVQVADAPIDAEETTPVEPNPSPAPRNRRKRTRRTSSRRIRSPRRRPMRWRARTGSARRSTAASPSSSPTKAGSCTAI
ncbi:hypothetical protein [Glycomyces rhizosphaerae]|uniref:Uncharacterized protein n=1 Tax=Glycomyces rhizosphaerae TaxID=2054422 RepID=A0ABV7Q1Q7_9ACTN